MSQLGAAGGGHTVTPIAGSVRQLDGSPAKLHRQDSYPVEAVCGTCGGPVRLDQMVMSPWRHIERFTMTGAGASS
ncbi:MAG: hypothetical protein ABSB59_28330 [Streptosporangiaceae bacterium]|jgi:hypothetical protein